MPKDNLIDCDNVCPSVYDLGFDYVPESIPHNAFLHGGETEAKPDWIFIEMKNTF